MTKISTRKLAQVALLIALEIVLSRFLSINTPITRIGFAFVPLVICAVMFGPAWSVAAAVAADLIGVAFFNTTGTAFFPGWTLNSALTGLLYGLLLYHKRNPGMIHTTVVAVVNNFIISLCLGTYWLSVTRGLPFLVLLPTRAPQAVLIFGVQMVMLPALLKVSSTLNRHFKVYEEVRA